VAGTVVVCHGSASGADVASGIGLAARLHRLDVSARLIAEAHDLPVEAP
jgi:glycerol-3-phosphate acyltransferase PlsX